MKCIRVYFVAILIIQLIGSSACTEITDIEPISTIGFLNDEIVISEAGGLQKVTLELNKPLTIKGTVKLSSPTENASKWINFPSVIQVNPGTTVIDFFITPINNAILEGPRQIQLSISEPSTGLVLNSESTLIVNLTED